MPSDRELGARSDVTLLSPVWDQSVSMATVQKSNGKRSGERSSQFSAVVPSAWLSSVRARKALTSSLVLGMQWDQLGQRVVVSRTKEGVEEHS